MKNKRREALIITMEECGELIQACSKVIRTMQGTATQSVTKRWRDKLVDEVGDVVCMIEILKMAELVTDQEIEIRKEVKKRKLEKWSSIFDDRIRED